MRFYNENHQYYCGIDLHARNMYVCILDHPDGEKVVHRKLPRGAARGRQRVDPCRDGRGGGVCRCLQVQSRQ